MQVIQVIQVIQNIQIMQVRLAQMWVDFWVILQKIANCRSWTLFWILSSRTTFLQIIILDIFCNWLFWNILVLTKCRTSKIFCNSAVPYQCINLVRIVVPSGQLYLRVLYPLFAYFANRLLFLLLLWTPLSLLSPCHPRQPLQLRSPTWSLKACPGGLEHFFVHVQVHVLGRSVQKFWFRTLTRMVCPLLFSTRQSN